MTTIKHGTQGGYTAGCRQECCRTPRRLYAQNRRRQIAYGRWQAQLIPAHDTQIHIKQLLADGVTVQAIARASGITHGGIQGILNGTHTRRSTAQAILNVTPPTGYSNHTPAAGSIRRIQGLMLLGWSTTAINTLTGLPAGTVKAVVNRKNQYVTRRVHDAIEAATRTLLTRTPPANRWTSNVKTRARQAGYTPLLLWDDIDDPTAVPWTEPVHDDATANARRSRVDPEVVDRVWELHRQGLSDREVADRVGYATAAAVCKLRARHPRRTEQ